MSFKIRDLSVLAYAQSHTHWLCRATGDDLADCAAPGYFNDAESMMRPGDIVTVIASNGVSICAVATAGIGVVVGPLKAWPVTAAMTMAAE